MQRNITIHMKNLNVLFAGFFIMVIKLKKPIQPAIGNVFKIRITIQKIKIKIKITTYKRIINDL